MHVHEPWNSVVQAVRNVLHFLVVVEAYKNLSIRPIGLGLSGVFSGWPLREEYRAIGLDIIGLKLAIGQYAPCDYCEN